MPYLKYGFYAVLKKPLFNVLILLELAAILVVGNMTIAAYNSRSAFYEPYREILSQDGFLFIGRATGGYDQNLTLKTMCDSLEGDVTVIHNYGMQLVTDDVRFIRNVVAVDGSLFSKMKLPVTKGRWASTDKNADGAIEAVVWKGSDKNDARTRLGSVIEGTINDQPCRIKIVGVIGEGQYIPALAGTIHSDKSNGSVMSFYTIPENTNGCLFFVAASADEMLSDPHNIAQAVSFMYYNTPPSEDIRQRNQEKLMANAKHLARLSDYNHHSLDYLHEQYIKLLPILLCVFIIVLAELICSVAMNTRSQMKNYGIYFLCGCRWRDCLKIALSYALILLTGGCMLGAAALLLIQQTEYAALFGQHLALNNLYITLLIAAVMLVLSLVIPFLQLRRASPVETIKANRL